MKLTILFVLMYPVLLFAQPGEQIVGSNMFLVTEIIPENNQIDAFDSVIVHFINTAHINHPPMSWTIKSDLNQHLYYLTGITNFSDLDKFSSDYGLLFQDRIPDYADSCDHCITSYTQYFLKIRDDLSYLPKIPERRFLNESVWDCMYFPIGSEKEIESLFLEFKRLIEKTHSPNPVRIFQGGIGISNNLYIIGFSGSDQADVWVRYKTLLERMGSEANSILTRIISLSEKRELLHYRIRSDLIKRIKNLN